ncbi:MAG: sigma 54-interacting transcriptional regulator [Thermoanaerobaculia bacterium]
MPNDSEGLRRLLQADTRVESGGGLPVEPLLVPGLTILYHPELTRIGERVPLPGLVSSREEGLSRTEPAFAQPGGAVLRPLADPYVSRRPLRLAPGSRPGSVRLIQDESGTTVIADGEPLGAEREFTPEEIENGVVLLLSNRVVLILSLLDPVSPAAALPDFGLVGQSAGMVLLRDEIRRVAGLDVPVLLRGETGTGKELVAHALHTAGPRSSRPYLAINMAAVPATLAASELFGAARGAFTGADRKRLGYLQRADGGTLFMDEVGETPAELQVLLLRALETGEIQPVGGDEPVRVDVRLIAATDADLEGAVSSGRFRAPLLHRLSGYEILVPPLRRRRDDFGRLFLHFLREELEEIGEARRLATPPEGRPWIPAALVARLAVHDWPGNVRQLRNVVRQMAIAGVDAGDEGMLVPVERLFQEAARAGLPDDTDATGVQPEAPAARPPRRVYRRPEEVGEDEMLEALRKHRWRIQRAAEALGISRTSLYDLIEKSSRIRKAVDLGREEIEECYRRSGGDLDAMVEVLEVSRRGLQRRMTQLGLT